MIHPTLRGLADFDGHVVISTGGAQVDALGPLPANALAAQFLPYDKLLPRFSALVTNGGYGTTLLALRHGVPLVVAPGAEDKPEVAARIHYFGVGVNLRTSNPEPARIAAAVRAVLGTPPQRDRGRAMAEAIDHYRPLETIRRELEGL